MSVADYFLRASPIILTSCIITVGTKPIASEIPKYPIFISCAENKPLTPGTNTAKTRNIIPARKASSENLFDVKPTLNIDLSLRQLKP